MNTKIDSGYRSYPRDHNGALPSFRNNFGHIAIDLLRHLVAGNGDEAMHEISLIRRAHGFAARREDDLAACEEMIGEGRIRDAERLIDGASFSRPAGGVKSVYENTQKMAVDQ